ncbi:MAG: arylesterase [Gammaproteobacteria bacterium]
MFFSIRLIFACSLALLLLLSGGSWAEDRHQAILIVGDSLSAGYGLEPDESWVALLRNRLMTEGYGHRVVNASISGDTTGGGLRRLPRALEVHRPVIVIIELGGNDGLRGTPVMIIRNNIARMIEMAQDAGARVVLAGMVMPPNYGEKYTNGFADLYIELAEDYDAGLVPFFMKGVALDPDKMQPDRIHPNAAGQPVLLDNLWPVLVDLL